jgi:hypothetical protein
VSAAVTATLAHVCPKSSETPAYQYFNYYVLDISDGIGSVGYVNWKVAVALLIGWILIFLALSKGVESLGKYG